MNLLHGLLAALSLLAVFKAPAKPLWFAAIVATEWGHYLALASLVLAGVTWRMTRRWGTPVWIALGAAVLYLTPLYRARIVAQDLPAQLTGAFGPAFLRDTPLAPARSAPLQGSALFQAVQLPEVQLSTAEYKYIEGVSLQMDLYRPLRSTALLPGVIVVHGGSWQGGYRQEFSALNRYLAARGYCVVAIDYRLAPRFPFPAAQEDVFSAIHYLKAHARELGLDPDQLVLLGRSAGGQIALSAAYALQEPAIQGVIVFYAPNDLVWGYANPSNRLIMNSRKVIEEYLGGPPAQLPGVYEAASPLNFVNRATPRTLMIHGNRDELVSARHEERLSKRLNDEGPPFLYLKMPWATHGCDVNFNGPCGQLSTYAIERFLAAVMP